MFQGTRRKKYIDYFEIVGTYINDYPVENVREVEKHTHTKPGQKTSKIDWLFVRHILEKRVKQSL